MEKNQKLIEEREQISRKIQALEDKYWKYRSSNPTMAEHTRLQIAQLKKELQENLEGTYHNSMDFYGLNKVEQTLAASEQSNKQKFDAQLTTERDYIERQISKLQNEYFNIIAIDPAQAERIKLEIEQLKVELNQNYEGTLNHTVPKSR